MYKLLWSDGSYKIGNADLVEAYLGDTHIVLYMSPTGWIPL
jgi:hypothetical protein